MTWETPVLWILAGVMVGGLAEFVSKRGSDGPIADVGLGLGGSVLGGSIAWISGVPGGFAMALVGALGAAGAVLVQRRLYHRRPARPARRRAVPGAAWRPESRS